MSLDFCCNIQMVGSEFGVKSMKAWIILPCLNGSGCWWWCNGVGHIFLARFGPFSTNWASFKCHSLPEYCCWPCPSLYDYSVPIFWWLRDAIMSIWSKISEECFLNLVESMPQRIKAVLKARGVQPGTSKVPNKVASECIYSNIYFFLFFS